MFKQWALNWYWLEVQLWYLSLAEKVQHYFAYWIRYWRTLKYLNNFYLYINIPLDKVKLKTLIAFEVLETMWKYVSVSCCPTDGIPPLFFKVPRFRPFVLLVRLLLRWRVWNVVSIMLTEENGSTWRKTCPGATLAVINFTWTGPGSNQGLRGLEACEKFRVPWHDLSIIEI